MHQNDVKDAVLVPLLLTLKRINTLPNTEALVIICLPPASTSFIFFWNISWICQAEINMVVIFLKYFG